MNITIIEAKSKEKEHIRVGREFAYEKYPNFKFDKRFLE